MAIKTFTAAEKLTASDTNTFLANAGLVFINTLSLSAVATGAIDSVFTSTHTSYRLVITSGAASANTALFIQFRSGGTAYTTANQSTALVGLNAASGASDNAASATFAGMYIGNCPTTAGRHLATVDIMNPQVATNTVLNIQTMFADSGGTISRAGGGVVPTTTQYDGFQISTLSAITVTTTCRIYGYRQA